jgi:peptide/nickel transport system permease protein
LFGARISFVISLVVVTLCLFTGLVAGFLAGYFGGLIDRVFLFVSDLFQAFPGILLAIAIAAFLPASVLNLILLLSFVGWVSYFRVIRAQVIEMKRREFILAGQALGMRKRRLLFYHFLPNMAGPIIVQASFGMAGVILSESTLSFLGLGLPENVPSLGKLMDSGVNLLLIAPHVSIFPGLIIMAFVLFFNLMGDRLRAKMA